MSWASTNRIVFRSSVPPLLTQRGWCGRPDSVFVAGETSARQIKTWFDAKGKKR